MFNLKMADFNILIKNKYPYIEKMCKDYITADKDFDFFISVSDEEISAEKTEDLSQNCRRNNLA